MNTPTPDTDKRIGIISNGSNVVDASWARQLERERDEARFSAEHRKHLLEGCQFHREKTEAERDDLISRLDLLANQMVYEGNSVAYIYQKCAAYKNIIGQCCDQFKMDGKTSVVDLIKAALLERDQLRKVADELSLHLKNHQDFCSGPVDSFDSSGAALHHYNSLPHVIEKGQS